MRFVIILLVICLVGKDITFAPFPYGLRAIAEVSCLLAALFGIASGSAIFKSGKYTAAWLYLFALIPSMLMTTFPLFVALEIGSLASVILYFMVYFDKSGTDGSKDLMPFAITVLVVYTIASVASLVALKLIPSVAYEVGYAGDATGMESRFRGLYPKAGGMGTSAGLAAGLALLLVRKVWMRIALFVPNAICLVLTQSRTFWIALIVGLAVTMVRKRPNLLPTLAVGSAVVLTLIFGLALTGGKVDFTGIEKLMRLDTVSNLTGRTSIWTDSLEGFTRHPLFGYGFTMGSTALSPQDVLAAPTNVGDDPRQWAKITMHDGYLQCLLDTGLFGAVFYVTAIVTSLRRIVRCDREVRYAAALFGLVYLVVANLTESVIYAASSFPSICFWAFAVFAMSLNDGSKTLDLEHASTRVQSERPFGNLMT